RQGRLYTVHGSIGEKWPIPLSRNLLGCPLSIELVTIDYDAAGPRQDPASSTRVEVLVRRARGLHRVPGRCVRPLRPVGEWSHVLQDAVSLCSRGLAGDPKGPLQPTGGG